MIEGLTDKVEEVGAGGVRMGKQELGDGASKAGQEFAIRSSVHAVMGLLDSFFGGAMLLA